MPDGVGVKLFEGEAVPDGVGVKLFEGEAVPDGVGVKLFEGDERGVDLQPFEAEALGVHLYSDTGTYNNPCWKFDL